jgi:D-lactate dehydrogenase
VQAIDSRLLQALEKACSSVATRATDRLSAAHDASHYLLTPQAVASPASRNEVAALFAACRQQGVPLTFRSGGTSLSGQAGTAGVLVDTRRHFRAVTVLDDGDRVRCEPGATVRAVNTRLLRHGRKLGPDPASEIACTIGGVVSNNSSGMSCGIHANTYRTLDSAVIVLPSGTTIDTGDANADEVLRATEPELYDGLAALRERVRSNPDSIARIRSLYSIKNTMGYGLNSFVDHDRPVDILEHLVIGSEGTLAFVAEATFATIPIKPHLATGLLIFPDLAAATSAVPLLVEAGFATVELLDATSLKVAQRDPGAPAQLRAMAVATEAALLVEYQELSADDLAGRVVQAQTLFAGLALARPAELSTDPAQRAALWHLRKGLYTLVAGNRPAGTTALLEDIAVPTGSLYATSAKLTALFEKYAYEESVIFGHAKDGNIHFMLNERFDRLDSLRRYEAFTEEMVELVLSQGGTLKAEHGTGRIMAPFVRRQYGDELCEVMHEVKSLFDPEGILNPGVLLNEDPSAHVSNLKTAPRIEEEVDRCVECGYCEPVCPSRDLTLTPRQRIVLRREMAEAQAAGDSALLKELRAEFEYDGVQTCAVDGMCQTACPVLINTGDLVRRLRRENQGKIANAAWKAAAGQWGAATAMGGAALTMADAAPAALPIAATALARAVIGAETVPAYSPDLPKGGAARRRIAAPEPTAIYFPSCTNTLFAPVGGSGVAESFLRLCERAGIPISTPEDIPALCCGTPWKSKGLSDGYQEMTKRVTAALRRATRDGELPVISDASSCTEGLRLLLSAAQAANITVIDAVEFVDSIVLPRLTPAGHKVESVTLHPTCSSVHLGLGPALARVAAAAADAVVVPDDWGCCAFAGDRGMLHPELTAAATAPEAAGAIAADTQTYASLNRTCELGMTRATGREYEHILQVLDRATDV